MERPRSPEHDDSARRLAAALLRLMVFVARSGTGIRDLGPTASMTLLTLEVHGPQRVTELASAEGVTQPSMSGIVSSLERAGLVERRRDPHDRRVVLVDITAAGANYLQQRRDLGVGVLAGLLGALDAVDSALCTAAVPVLERLSLEAARLHITAP